MNHKVSHLFSLLLWKRGNRRRSLQHKRTFILPAGKGVYDAFECISSSELMSSNALKAPKLLLFPIFSFTFCGVQKEHRSVFFIQFSSLPFSFLKYKAFSPVWKQESTKGRRREQRSGLVIKCIPLTIIKKFLVKYGCRMIWRVGRHVPFLLGPHLGKMAHNPVFYSCLQV